MKSSAKKNYGIQKRIKLLGVFGLLILIILLLFGFRKKPNHVIVSSFSFTYSYQTQKLINHFLTNIPTTDSENDSSIETNYKTYKIS